MLEEITEDTIGGFDQDFVTGMLTWFKNGGQSSLEELKKSLIGRSAINIGISGKN